MADPKLKVVLEVKDNGSIRVRQFGKVADQTATKLGKFSSKAKKASVAVGGFTKGVVKAGTKVAALGTAVGALGGVMGVKALQQFADFERAWQRIGNVSDQSLDTIRTNLLGMAPAYGNLTELAQGYYQVISAGVTEQKKSLDLLTIASQVAVEAQIEQVETVKGLAALLGAYSEELRGAADAADTLYTTERLGITAVAELIPYIGNLANLAKASGLSLDEFAASLAQTTAAGQGTSIAVTQLQAVLKGISKPKGEMKALFPEFGGSPSKALESEGFLYVLKRIKEESGGTAEGLTKLFGRIEGVQGVLQLMKNDFGDLEEKMGQMSEKTGAATDAWERYSKTLSGIWSTFKNVVTNQVILIGEKLAPAIKALVETIGDWLQANREIITGTLGDWIESISNWIWYDMIPAFQQWFPLIRQLASELSQFFNIIMKTISGINSLISGVSRAWNYINRMDVAATNAVVGFGKSIVAPFVSSPATAPASAGAGSSSGGNSFTYINSPTYQSGDPTQARQMATDFREELDRQGVRWGDS